MQVIADQCDTALILTGALDNSTVDEVHKALLAHLEHHSRISLNLSQIESCDAAGLQLLIAMQRSAGAAAKPFAVIAPTNAFTTACANLGISSTQFAAAAIPLLEPVRIETDTTID
jgi:ABC-type transporter Mla MlaB component